MSIKFQYNKTSLGELDKQLKMRRKALPTIKSKESALRLEVKKARQTATEFERQLGELTHRYEYMTALWGEWDADLVRVKDVELSVVKIAGVRIPVLDRIVFDEKAYDLFSSPIWYADGIELLRQLATLRIEYDFFARKTHLLDRARKKTTQKVNLYEKVQIPGFQEAILKIKRFLEDEENLSKSSQKIVKTRQAAAVDAAINKDYL
ncbi:MAG: V-type ATP synthase subunit D [Rikenellaceae bacterium]|nr:V-type ATP synthase subunit D [Rikenellaceae bacterium]MCL2693183.1 V-type ATP synthase subunit D [Rikenellaceae bacterium]